MVLVEKIFELTSQVVAPTPSSKVQMAWAYSYDLSTGTDDGEGEGEGGCDSALAVAVRLAFMGVSGSAINRPSDVIPLVAPLGHVDDNFWVITTPFGMVHLTCAVASSEALVSTAIKIIFAIIRWVVMASSCWVA